MLFVTIFLLKIREVNTMDKAFEYFPLTHPQKGIWFTEKLHPGTSIGNIAATLRIKEDIDFDLMDKAINLVIEKNDAFRTRIDEINNEPKQYITEYIYKKIDFLDFSNQSIEKLYEWDEKQAHTPFELIKSDLCYFALIKINEDTSGFFIKIHHTIADAWSIILFGNEVMEFYRELKCGKEIDHSTYPSYIDYVLSEKKYMESDRCIKDKAFWNEKFNEVPEAITLKTKKSNEITTVAKRKTFVLPLKLCTKIQGFCTQNNVSILNLFSSALSIYINRITEKGDIVFGTPVLNRLNHIEKETIGMYISMAPVRLQVDQNLDFASYVKYVAKELISLLRHQRYSTDLIIVDLKEKHREIDKLFDITLSYQNSKFMKAGNSGKQEGRWHFCGNQAESLNIHINEREDDGKLVLDYDYLTELFYLKEIEFMHDHIIRVLWHALDNPQKLISELEMVSEREKQKILFEFNNTVANYPKDKTIHQLFEDQICQNANNIAVTDGEKRFNYDEINKWANKLANLLRKKGIGREDIVGILMNRSVEMIVSILAVIKAGGAYLPLDPDYPRERTEYMLEDSKAKILILNGINKIENYEGYILDLHSEKIDIYSDENLCNINTPDDLIYIIYTSGSTGKPKGAMLEHRNLVSLMKNDKMHFDFNNRDVWSVFHSFCFDFSVWEMYGALLYGGRLVIVPKYISQDPERFLILLKRERVTVLNQIPTAFYNLSNEVEKFNLNDLKIRYVIFGGEALKPAKMKKWKIRYPNCKLINMYGITETTVHVTYKEITDEEIRKNTCNIGVPIPTLKTYIFDKNMRLVPISTKGELMVAGDGVSRGYLNNPELTNQKFIENPYVKGETIYRSGDTARWYANGEIEYLGRLDTQIKLRGFRVELGEIESRIISFKDIKDAVVTLKKDKTGNEHLYAYFESDLKVDIAELKNYLAEKLPLYMIPAYYLQLQKMPLTASGKVDKKVLLTYSGEEVVRPVFVEPRNDVEIKLAEAWKELFKIDKVGINDNFFELGGDSLSIIKVQVKILECGWKINTQDFYQYPTIAQLSEFIVNNINNSLEDEYDDQIKALDFKAKINNIEFNNVFLTGATGFLGIHILKELLNMKHIKIICLLRGKQDDEYTRLKNIFKYYFGKYEHFDEKRITVINGDIAKPLLGMDKNSYEWLAKNCDIVIHTAANVKHYGNYEDFEKVNVFGTKHIVEFCQEYNRVLHHISTISVSGNYLAKDKNTKCTFNEDNFYIGQNINDNVYIKSKFHAEEIILNASNAGLKASIYRIGNITGRYSDGQFQNNINDNAFYNRLKSIILLKAVSKNLSDVQIEMTPVDYCSKAIVLLLKADELNRVYHLYNNSIKMKTLISLLQEKTELKIKTFEEEEFKQYIIKTSRDKNKQIVLNGIINELDGKSGFAYETMIEVDCEKTINTLSKMDFKWPSIDSAYLEKIVDHIKKVRFLQN